MKHKPLTVVVFAGVLILLVLSLSSCPANTGNTSSVSGESLFEESGTVSVTSEDESENESAESMTDVSVAPEVSDIISDAVSEADESDEVSDTFPAVSQTVSQTVSLTVSQVTEESRDEPEESEGKTTIEITSGHKGRYATPVSAGKTYTVSVPASPTYPDGAGKLTDGVFAKENFSYENHTYCGYTTRALNVTVDLADERSDVYGFEISFLSLTQAGVAPVSSATVRGSNDGTTWTTLGSCTVEPHVEGTSKKAYLYLDKTVGYRYIGFTINQTASWLFLDELSVIADIPYEKTKEGMKVMNVYLNDTEFAASRTEGIKKLRSGKKTDVSKGIALVSYGCSYTVTSAGYDSRIELKNSVLTDGDDLGASISEKVWVGVKADKGASVTVDLRRNRENVYSFALSCIGGTDGIVLPSYVDIYAGPSADKLYPVGRAFAPLGGATHNMYTVSLSECINARFVKFVMPAAEGAFYRFEEAAVYEIGGQEKTNYHGDYKITRTPVSYWDKGEDFTKVQNLALGRECMIFCDVDLLAYADKNPKTPQLVTDGVKSNSTECYNGKWLQNNGGSKRTYVIDLGHTSAVTGFCADFINLISWGISIPDSISFSVSEDGENWYIVKDVEIKKPYAEDTVQVFSFDFGKAYLARFAKLDFSVSGHVFIDEFEVFGRKDTSGAVSASSDGFISYTGITSSVSKEEAGYAVPDPNLLGGVRDVMLVYHNTATAITEDLLLPYVGYVGTDGKVTDTMWDGFLFLPTTGALPSGARPDGGNTVKRDWESVYDSLVGEGINFEALNSVVGKVGKTLGIKNYKVKIYVSIINISPTVTDFGDVDGDGVSENMSVAADRRKVVEWYMAKIEKALASGKYPNLELCGYYWFSEQCSGVYEQIVKETAATVHSKGEQFFWIPWFCAGGYEKWRELGFDVACMQPNYAFNMGIPENRLTINAELTKANGLCYEMECWGKLFSDEVFLRKYMNYMKHGVTEGYAKAINMYYQDVNLFAVACHSENAPIRLMYDYQHSYMKDTLIPVPETPPALSMKAKTNSPFTASLAVKESAIRNYKIVVSPSHGSLTVSRDGTFTYYPDKGYTGEDEFSYCIDEYLYDSAPATVKITVSK